MVLGPDLRLVGDAGFARAGADGAAGDGRAFGRGRAGAEVAGAGIVHGRDLSRRTARCRDLAGHPRRVAGEPGDTAPGHAGHGVGWKHSRLAGALNADCRARLDRGADGNRLAPAAVREQHAIGGRRALGAGDAARAAFAARRTPAAAFATRRAPAAAFATRRAAAAAGRAAATARRGPAAATPTTSTARGPGAARRAGGTGGAAAAGRPRRSVAAPSRAAAPRLAGRTAAARTAVRAGVSSAAARAPASGAARGPAAARRRAARSSVAAVTGDRARAASGRNQRERRHQEKTAPRRGKRFGHHGPIVHHVSGCQGFFQKPADTTMPTPPPVRPAADSVARDFHPVTDEPAVDRSCSLRG